MFGGDLPVSHHTVNQAAKGMGDHSYKLSEGCQINLIFEFLSANGIGMTVAAEQGCIQGFLLFDN